jgi:hypothetical protein
MAGLWLTQAKPTQTSLFSLSLSLLQIPPPSRVRALHRPWLLTPKAYKSVEVVEVESKGVVESPRPMCDGPEATDH